MTTTALSTVGTLGYHQLRRQRPVWSIKARPHVMMTVKRVLPRVRPDTSGAAFIADTLEVARDIDWIHSRYPLEMSQRTAEVLAERVGQWTERQHAVDAILAGHPGGALLAEPARPPREYQLQFAAMLRATGRILLADDLGLGKSYSALLALAEEDALPALVVCLTHLPGQWLRELELTWPGLRGHIITKGTPYDLQQAGGGCTPDVVISNYHKLSGWADALTGQVRTVIFDECQELRNGLGTWKGVAAGQIANEASRVIGCSATPVYNYGGEIHNIYEILAPGVLGSRDEFLREWGSGGPKGIVEHPEELGTYLRDSGLLLRRTRKDVHLELPEPLRIRHEIDADPKALEDLAGDALAMARLVLDSTADKQQRWSAGGQLDMRMRMATGVAKAPYVAAFVDMLLESVPRVLLFGWHRSVYQIWLDKLRHHRPVLYTGTESPAQKDESAAAFIDGNARVMMMSLRAGAGLDGLQKACSVAVFGELDWSPGVLDQCIGRLARDGQEETVAAYFLMSDQGSDPPMDDVLGLKRAQAEPIRNPGAPLLAASVSDPDRIRLLAQSVLDRAAGRGKAAGS